MRPGARGTRILRLGGVAVVVHWSVLLMLPVAFAATGRFLGALAATLAYFGLILAHETGHALMARWRGLRVIEINLVGFHGRCIFQQPRHLEDHIFVAWGGALAQAAVLVAAVLLLVVMPRLPAGLAQVIGPAFFVWIPINLLVLAINLLPIRTLDGAVAWGVVPMLRRRWRNARRYG
ncbi:hypothetical protein [Tahibacter amnicola]|uniref:Peptidase M50 domain-containing protein n=1 Tax=Tahibacter amnicola TaxID=2976241 RepID=A0ABY6B9H9_9GAMM|nr:hypothetical protein [Tahibacter amnicola]UXI66509.1 hypothetical protein N4264_17365 [Tahibacter amnicola]